VYGHDEENMDQKIIASFVKPAALFWDAEYGRGLKLASSTTRPASFRANDIVVTALVSGDLSGEIHYVIDEGTAQVIYSAHTGKWSEEMTDEVTDKIVENITKFARASVKNLSTVDLDVKVRVVGSIISDGALMGPTTNIGQLEHMFARRPGTGEEDHLRIWMYLKDADGVPLPVVDRVTVPEELDLDPQPEMVRPGKDKASAPGNDGPADVVRAKRFELVSEDGETVAVLGALANGSPHLVLSDKNGRMRAAVALSKNGTPRIILFDEVGERIWEEPAPVQVPARQQKAA
jgi:CheY-specific phosphatase CheX